MKTFQRKMKVWIKVLLWSLAIFLMGVPFCVNAASPPTIKIGVVGPMKFPSGQHIWWGAEMAADEINKAGGVLVKGVSHKIEVVKGDTNELLSVPDAVNTVQRLITFDKVNFLVGGMRSEAVLAYQELMADHRIVLINVSAAHPLLCERIAKNYDRYKYFFRGALVNSDDMGKLVYLNVSAVIRAVQRELGINRPRVAAIVEKAKWADPLVGTLPELIKKMGGEPVGIWRPSSMAADVKAELASINSAEAHVIATYCTGTVGVSVSRQWGEIKVPAALVGDNLPAMDQAYWGATGGMCNYEVTIDWFGNVKITDKTIPFYNNYIKRYGEWPIYSANSYDGLYLLVESIKRAGTLDSDAVVHELEKTDYKGASGRIVFTKKDSPMPHDSIYGPGYLTCIGKQWRDGKCVVVWPDGHAQMGDKSWEGIRYEGTADYQLPPWMIKYWKSKK